MQILQMSQNNQYLILYENSISSIQSNTTMQQAEKLALQMGMMYNTLGIALKDTINLLSHLYRNHVQNKQKGNNQIKQTNRQTPVIISDDQSEKKIEYAEQNKNIQKNKIIINSGVKQPIQEVNYIQSLPKMMNFDQYRLGYKQLLEKPSKIESVLLKQKSRIEKKNQNQEKIQRIEKVRNKKQREELNGYSCVNCQKFYNALGEDFSGHLAIKKLCNNCSKHRSNFPATNYFNDFSQQFGFDD